MDIGERLARKFHDTYERLAPDFGYETRDDTKAFDPTTPNGKLMIAVCEQMAPEIHRAGKETSARVSTIASAFANFRPRDLSAIIDDKAPDAIAEFCGAIRIISTSALSQDQTPGQSTQKGDFLSRLKDEREELERRLIALNSYLSHNPGHPNPRHNAMLTEQSKLMSDLLAVLDERLADIEISQRSIVETENTND